MSKIVICDFCDNDEADLLYETEDGRHAICDMCIHTLYFEMLEIFDEKADEELA